MSGEDEASELRKRLKEVTADRDQRAREVGELAKANAELGLLVIDYQGVLKHVRQIVHQAHHKEAEPANCKLESCHCISQALAGKGVERSPGESDAQ